MTQLGHLESLFPGPNPRHPISPDTPVHYACPDMTNLKALTAVEMVRRFYTYCIDCVRPPTASVLPSLLTGRTHPENLGLIWL